MRLAEIINELIRPGTKPRIRLVPYEDFGGNYEDVRRRIPDLSKAEKLLGFRWKVGIKEGLVSTIEWHRQNPILVL